uniref:Uncharacterized protein n=2 Tax=Picea TaxID=3328 RepID=A0A117NHA5_PICGL|nr:hypothetical protein ABT39_MTgene5059 [Picea glauca]QHR89754.1 hypothetical protein Q903MT_gene3776 [Picea sitchensis]
MRRSRHGVSSPLHEQLSLFLYLYLCFSTFIHLYIYLLRSLSVSLSISKEIKGHPLRAFSRPMAF